MRPAWVYEVVTAVQRLALTFDENSETAIRQAVSAPATPLEGMLLDGLVAMSNLKQKRRQSPQPPTSLQTPDIITRARQLLQQRYMEALSYVTLGRELGCDPEYLESRFRQDVGQSLHAFLTNTRIEKASPLLERGQKVESVALQVGFRSKSGFLRAFRRVTGHTPRVASSRNTLKRK